MDREEIERAIREIIADRLEHEPDPSALRDDVPIFRGGLCLDSIAAVELLLEVESRFDMRIDDDAFDVFDSLQRLVAYVCTHQGTSSRSGEGQSSLE